MRLRTGALDRGELPGAILFGRQCRGILRYRWASYREDRMIMLPKDVWHLCLTRALNAHAADTP